MTAFDPFPIIYVADVERSMTFYRGAFGFEPGFRWPTDGRAEFVYLKLPPSGIGLASYAAGRRGHGLPAEPGAAQFELCLYVDDMDEVCPRLEGLGSRQLRPPVDESWGERRAYYEDPDGRPLHIAMRLAQ